MSRIDTIEIAGDQKQVETVCVGGGEVAAGEVQLQAIRRVKVDATVAPA